MTVIMNRLRPKLRAQILLCEGSSIRAITRITGASKNTVTKLIEDVGSACAAFHDATVRGLKTKRIQVDEIWSFTYAKQKNVAAAKAAPDGAGDTWTWTGIDADSKLIVSWFIGARDSYSAKLFIDDLASRLSNRVQLTSDGLRAYLEAVEGAFGADVDYAQLQKIYGPSPEAVDELCRTPQPHHAHAHAPIHEVDQCILKENREPCPRGSAVHGLL